jgi:hypothetical protein
VSGESMAAKRHKKHNKKSSTWASYSHRQLLSLLRFFAAIPPKPTGLMALAKGEDDCAACLAAVKVRPS